MFVQPEQKLNIIINTFWEAVLYDQALTDRISIRMFGVHPPGSG